MPDDLQTPASPTGDKTPSRPPEGGVPKGVQIAIGALLVAGLLGWYGYTNLGEDASFQYYQTLDELRDAGEVSGRSLRVHGYVAEHSIKRDLGGKQVRFQVQNDPPHAAGTGTGKPLDVLYTSLETPDLFKDGAEVVVEGRIEGRGEQALFVASNVMAKCPSKFEAEAMAQAEGQPMGQAL